MENRMRRTLNIVLVVIFVVLITCIFSTKLLHKVGVPFPPEAGIGATTSPLEGSELQERPKLTAQTVSTGKFQSEVEAWASDMVPYRSSILLGNAALQRMGIATANTVFGYPCYPGFYGCDTVYIPEYDAAASMPESKAKYAEGIAKFAKRINAFAAAQPQRNFYLFVTDRSTNSEANPAVKLVADALTTTDAVDILKENITAGNVHVLSTPYFDSDTYYEDFYRGDHHWNMKGVINAYDTIMEAAGREGMLDPQYGVIDAPYSVGSSSRSALKIIEEEPMDLTNDLSAITMVTKKKNKVTTENGNEHKKYWGTTLENQIYNFYNQYYSKSFTNVEGTGEGEALLVADSYGKSLLRPLALSYENVIWENDLTFDAKSDDCMLELITDDTKDIIFVGHATNYAEFCKRQPHYFDIG